MDINLILRALELQGLFLALMIIMDLKSDGKLDLFQIDEQTSQEIERGFEIIVKKLLAILKEIEE